MKSGIGGMRGSQKIMDNCTQLLEVYRDLDPDILPEDRGKVEIIQMKDTAQGENGKVEIYFWKSDYYETQQQEDDINF